jgi:hypothetical protein
MEIVVKHYRSDEGLKIHEDEFDQGTLAVIRLDAALSFVALILLLQPASVEIFLYFAKFKQHVVQIG